MLKYKEAFVCGLTGRREYTDGFSKHVYVMNVEIGFFMMQKPDTKEIIYQDSLGDYHATTEKQVILLSEKKIEEELEANINEVYQRLMKVDEATKNKELVKLDNLIGVKGLYLQQLNDLARKNTPETPLSPNQIKSVRELKKALKKLNRRIYAHETKANECDRKLELLETGKITSIENMKRLIKSMK